MLETIDKHASKEGVNRSEAIRRLVELGLTVKARPKQSAHAGSERAKD
jgi:metal-responsive CopG/Arc/MetJ family transcriptional regulator